MRANRDLDKEKIPSLLKEEHCDKG